MPYGIKVLLCEHLFLKGTDTQAYTHANIHTHICKGMWLCMAYWIQCNMISYCGSWSKKYENHWFNTRPILMVVFRKTRQRKIINLPLRLKHTHALTGLFRVHLEDTASQSWPSPLGRWPVRPTTEGRGLLLPGEGFWEWWATLTSWQ